MKNRSTSLVLAAVVAVSGLAALPARAEGLYVGGNLGKPYFDDAVNGIGGTGDGLAGKLYGGYQFTPNFALEAGGAHLGKIEDNAGRVTGRAAFVDAVGTLPLARDFSLIGRVGVAHVNYDTSLGDDNGTGVKVGAGLQYDISSSTAVRAEWERYHVDVFGSKPDTDQFTVGVRYAF